MWQVWPSLQLERWTRVAVALLTFRVALTTVFSCVPQLRSFKDASDAEANHNAAAMTPNASRQRKRLLSMATTVMGPS
jgi:hypothetical protein